MNEKHMGSDLDHFLREEGLLVEVEAVAAERLLAHESPKDLEEQELSEARIPKDED